MVNDARKYANIIQLGSFDAIHVCILAVTVMLRSWDVLRLQSSHFEALLNLLLSTFYELEGLALQTVYKLFSVI